jgi:tetratricopeptide (TPR) repeat protein
MDHGKRDTSQFPIATGTYYKMDYSSGVDISRYKNIPVPTSYMAYHSDYNFVGGYDYEKRAGILHIADHHISPGKKQWTWGCGEFGQAWDRNLTDEDGPYVELMTGCYTDNQPDFSWIAPYEEKVFTQYFMPYKEVGSVKNATIDAAVNLEVNSTCATVIVYSTSEFERARIIVKGSHGIYSNDVYSISPNSIYQKEIGFINEKEWELEITVFDCSGKEIIAYKPAKPVIEKMPDPAKEAPLPKDAVTTEDLFLYGMHLEQYRHATYAPEDYYLEGLRRDDSDIRLNNAYGSLLMRRGQFIKSEPFFQKVIQKITRSNPNPYDGGPYYNLGLCLKYQGRLKEAYDYLYKACWNGEYRDCGYYQLACIDCSSHEYTVALDHINCSLAKNYHNIKARNLKTAILRKMGRYDEAKLLAQETLTIDVLDLNSRNELSFLAETAKDSQAVKKWNDEVATILKDNHNSYIEIAIDYIESGLIEEAIILLTQYCDRCNNASLIYPMVDYYLAYCHRMLGQIEAAKHSVEQADAGYPDYCFPHRLEDLMVLQNACELRPELPKAFYYLGNLWYDKKQYNDAITCWEKSLQLDHHFPTVSRNLALAYYNKEKDASKALTSLEYAYVLDQTDSRILMELDQLYKKIGKIPDERIDFLNNHFEQVTDRDDLYVEYITLLNLLGKHSTALQMIMDRQFHPWEGGEGKVSTQYLTALVALAKEYKKQENYEEAIKLLERATGSYPINLGEGKLYGAQENHIYYYLGCALDGFKLAEKAKESYLHASSGLSEPVGMMYYNDQPPEMIYYQGMALLKLGRRTEAYSRFNKLIQYGEKHLFDKVRIDYFAVSLPDLQIFEEDLDRKNTVHCNFMMGLGYLGKQEIDKAEECFKKIAAIDVNHTGITSYSE